MNIKTLAPWRRNNVDLSTADSFEPSASVFSLHRQMNRLFDDFFRDFDGPILRGSATEWPALEVRDGEKEIKVVAELPGLEEKDIDLSLREGVLTIRGEKSHKGDGAVYSERWHGRFTRSIDLGTDVDPEKVKASFERGVLTVTLEKRSDSKTESKKIAINRS